MNIEYRKPTVEILTGEEPWNNLDMVATAAYVCHEKTSVYKDPYNLIKKYAFHPFEPHRALLEISNIEIVVGLPKTDAVYPLKCYYRHLARWAKGEPIDGIYTGSLRDIYRIKQEENGECSFEELMTFMTEGGKLWGLPAIPANIPKDNPQKRVALLIDASRDFGHKERTEKGEEMSIYMLAISGTHMAAQDDTVVIDADPEDFKARWEHRIACNRQEYKMDVDNISRYLMMEKGMSSKDARTLAKYEAKKAAFDFYRSLRVMVGSVRDIEEVCHKRLKSSWKKTEVHYVHNLILERLSEWKRTGKPTMEVDILKAA